jgi:GNAT superfamily N-acetyltransferase
VKRFHAASPEQPDGVKDRFETSVGDVNIEAIDLSWRYTPMQKRSFRRAESADASTVREITRAAYTKWVAVIGREPRPMTVNYEQAVIDHVIDLLEEEGRAIGLIEVIPAPLHQSPHLLIENVAVLPDWHGKGVGGLLVGRAEAVARSLRLNELRLYTNAMFSTNISFYARRGFQEFQREQHDKWGGVVHMKKLIEPWAGPVAKGGF